MLDIFEQPWTLVGAAVIVFFVVLTFRSVFPEKRHWWQWLIPTFLAASAFGLDLLVRTDLEKINTAINTVIKAVEEEDCNAIEAIIADNYSDSYHSTKIHLIAHCRRQLSKTLVNKHKKTGLLINISELNATATLFTIMTFDKNSYISKDYYKSFLLVKAKLYLQKQPDREWLINRVEVLELDRQPVNWSQIR
ncbi:MAG: hypothetical protein ACYS80_03780 [Planctomycetota bacterium]|jgi:hypothetical protein